MNPAVKTGFDSPNGRIRATSVRAAAGVFWIRKVVNSSREALRVCRILDDLKFSTLLDLTDRFNLP